MLDDMSLPPPVQGVALSADNSTGKVIFPPMWGFGGLLARQCHDVWPPKLKTDGGPGLGQSE